MSAILSSNRQVASEGPGGQAPNIDGVGCRLIINADDFGHSGGVNRAVIRAHAAGVLTSCSMMVAEPAAEEAVDLAGAHPRLAVGLHLTLIRGRSALEPEQVPALVDRDGRFGEDP